MGQYLASKEAILDPFMGPYLDPFIGSKYGQLGHVGPSPIMGNSPYIGLNKSPIWALFKGL